jgi:hypothetical protein
LPETEERLGPAAPRHGSIGAWRRQPAPVGVSLPQHWVVEAPERGGRGHSPDHLITESKINSTEANGVKGDDSLGSDIGAGSSDSIAPRGGGNRRQSSPELSGKTVGNRSHERKQWD